ncbi:MAG: hypothetical protein WCQ95_11480 [Bacteroidota bacterium]
MKTTFHYSLIAFFLISLSSCKVNEEAQVKKVSIDFLTSLNNKNYDNAKKLATTSTAQMLDMLAAFDKIIPDTGRTTPMDIKFVSCNINNDIAHCSYTNRGKQAEITLMKIKGKWLVDMKKEDAQSNSDSKKTAQEDSIKAAEEAYQDSISYANDRLDEASDTVTYFDFCLTEMKNQSGSVSVSFILNNRSEHDITHLWFCLYFSDSTGKFIQKKDLMFDKIPKYEIPEGDSVSHGNWQKVTMILEKTNADNIGEIYITPIRQNMQPDFSEDYEYGYFNDFLKYYTKFKNITGKKVIFTY